MLQKGRFQKTWSTRVRRPLPSTLTFLDDEEPSDFSLSTDVVIVDEDNAIYAIYANNVHYANNAYNAST